MNNLEVNPLISEAIEESGCNANVKRLILNALKYELDIWNRRLPTSDIMDEYAHLVEKSSKEDI